MDQQRRRRIAMSGQKKDLTKAHESIIVNLCDSCSNRYSYEEAKQRDFICCGQKLKEIEKRIDIPLGA